jgi:hypothetical protein
MDWFAFVRTIALQHKLTWIADPERPNEGGGAPIFLPEDKNTTERTTQ